MAVQSGKASGTAKLILILACVAPGLVARQQPGPAGADFPTPVVDSHQHLFSPAVQKISPTLQPMNAADLVKLLDQAGIRRERRAAVRARRAGADRAFSRVPGGYDDPAIDEALAVFVAAFGNRDPRMKNVYFDASGVIGVQKPTEKLDLIARRIRQIGVDRVLYGSDGALPPAYTPQKAWEAFRRLPLDDAEFEIIANNRVSYMDGADDGLRSYRQLIELLVLVLRFSPERVVRIRILP